jgi:hypothetical protein
VTVTDLPVPRPRDSAEPAAVEHTHTYGQCLTQWCPKFRVTGRFRRCLACGACQFC